MAKKKITGVPAPVDKDTYETVRALVEAVNELIKSSENLFTRLEALEKRIP